MGGWLTFGFCISAGHRRAAVMVFMAVMAHTGWVEGSLRDRAGNPTPI